MEKDGKLLACSCSIRLRNRKLLASSKAIRLRYHYFQYSISFGTRDKDHSKSEIFFDFHPYIINVPNNNDIITLNMTLNGDFDYFIRLFQMKDPINVIQRFDVESFPQDIYVKERYNIFIAGYIRQLGDEILIPTAIIITIKKKIEIGAAVFYCEGFKNPTNNIW